MSRGLSLKTMCDLCMAFSLFSSFMFPMRMSNPSSQSCVPSFQTLPYFLSSNLFFLLLFLLSSNLFFLLPFSRFFKHP